MNEFDKIKSENYLKAKKRVDEIKGFYWHLASYVLLNLFISTVKVINNLSNGETLSEAIFDFGTYALWIFWGIGIFFHALGVLKTNPLLGKKWEERKLKEFMDEEIEQSKKFNLRK